MKCPRVWDSRPYSAAQSDLEFDFSILCFDPVSWLTTAQPTCQGHGDPSHANKTRRLVAQVQEQLTGKECLNSEPFWWTDVFQFHPGFIETCDSYG